MTRLVDIDDFLPELRIYAPAVPDVIAYRHIRAAARDFCQRTRIWRDSDTITVTEPSAEGVTTIQDAAIYEIERADFGTERKPLTPITIAELDRDMPNWRYEEIDTTGEGAPSYVTQLLPDTVAIVPRMTGTLTLQLVLIPSRSAAQLPEILLSQHAETIGMGAASRALRTPNTEYSNPDLASSLRADFDQHITTAKTIAAKSIHRAPLRTRGRYL